LKAGEGVCTTQPMPPRTLEDFATGDKLGITVVGGGRVDLGRGGPLLRKP